MWHFQHQINSWNDENQEYNVYPTFDRLIAMPERKQRKNDWKRETMYRTKHG